MEANGSVDLAWNAARLALALALLCAFIAGALVLRWAAKKVPLHGSKRRFVQSLTVAGGVVGLIPGMLLGMIGGADGGSKESRRTARGCLTLAAQLGQHPLEGLHPNRRIADAALSTLS